MSDGDGVIIHVKQDHRDLRKGTRKKMNDGALLGGNGEVGMTRRYVGLRLAGMGCAGLVYSNLNESLNMLPFPAPFT